ncbi:hypothetical protein JM83_0790 [Gillisia sp. Hel_I_86]|uniref:DUF5690 family protein n=1 Tax=Gillisia sp. Hel_I_86 TaxID=1249981 RepID=UPI00119C6DE1|nr:DUF5690 family protein [Gillisia sp. Hel_I_86]TVZ25854.1 hypothetical protein JM83_0790 [Gillisia sp. Hel_I_86]
MIKRSQLFFILHAMVASFGAYFCMYAFRKPFTVATFDGLNFLGIDYKIWLIIAQVVGYMISKFIGIKIIAELKPRKRGFYLLVLIGLAELSLILFAFTPMPYNIIFMFLNGLPLGLIWGIVFSYLEGRKFTEFLGLALTSSFIISSGVVKSVGLVVMQQWNVSQFWMPSVTGGLFVLPLILFTWMLGKIPPPTHEDIRLRCKRGPMSKQERKVLIKTFLLPIMVLVLFYTFLTAFRDFRDNFSREIWDAIGFQGNASVYTVYELPIAFLVIIILGFLGFIKNNYKAFITYHYLFIAGVLVTGLATFCFQIGILAPSLWMVLVGFGLYICYVPFNCIFFDRMVAAFRIKGNSGFLIYIADSFGYLGSILILLYKNFGLPNLSWLNFFIYGSYVITFIGLCTATASMVYFKLKKRKKKDSKLYNLSLNGRQI